MEMVRRILVIKPSSFGDIVHLFPALGLLKRQYPDALLDFVVNPEFVSLLEFSPFPVDRTIIFERRKLGKLSTFFPALSDLLSELRREKYDLIIDFQGLFRSGLCTFFSRGKVRAGFAAPREKAAAIFYNRKIAVPLSHAVKRNVLLAEALCDLSSSGNV
jgi:ADP-heptose:LPS heptosyltransferase